MQLKLNKSTWERAGLAVPENNLILLFVVLLTVFSIRAVSKNLGSVRSFRTGILGFPFGKFNASAMSHLCNNIFLRK